MANILSLPQIITSSSVLLTIVGVFVLIGAIYLSRMKRREKELLEGKEKNMKSLPNNVSVYICNKRGQERERKREGEVCIVFFSYPCDSFRHSLSLFLS